MDFHDLILLIAPQLETKIDEVRANLKKQDLPVVVPEESDEQAETEDDQDWRVKNHLKSMPIFGLVP